MIRIVLPTGTNINPSSPGNATFFDQNQVAYVLRRLDVERSRPTRVLTGFGAVEAKIGTTWSLQHDQTGAALGTYAVVGIVRFEDMEAVGEIPNRDIAHCVFK